MKICPRCQKTYADENLNFCLEDGSVLSQMASMTSPTDAQTMVVNQPRITEPQPQFMSQPTAPAQPAWNTPQQQQPFSMQPAKKSSKTWVWVLLVLGAVVVLCGGGGALLVGLGLLSSDNTTNTTNSAVNTSPGNKGTNSTSTDTSGRKDLEDISLSKWVPDSSKFAEVEYTDGELLVKNKEKTFYYVLAGTDKQRSTDADSRVTVRNIDNLDTNLGYGIVFHSNPTPLQQGYAFVIDAKKKRYRIVNHTPNDEKAVVDWKSSDTILDGTQGNTLEVRDKADKIELYINGKMVNSIKNTFGYPNGVIGIYSSGALKIAFKDLQIRR